VHWLLVVVGILANALASTLVKTIPSHTTTGLLDFATNWRLIFSLACYGVAFLAYAAAVQKMPLNIAHPVSTAGAIILVGLVSALFFHESFGPLRVLGYGLLLAGILAIAFAS
jgi:small multidrug resistance pump